MTRAAATEQPARRLRRADSSEAGIVRRRRGRGFTYLDEDGQRVGDEETLERIEGLAIPPAWEQVWICSHPQGHIQATGVDVAGRKQYRYHDDWTERSSQRKFDEMLGFARALPKLRRAITRDLKRDGMPRERSLAVAARLLDIGLFRVGGEHYAEENGSYGLATIRRDHVSVSGTEMIFDFPAKSGQRRRQSIRDASVSRAVVTLKRRRGGADDLLAFRDGRTWRDIKSADVNAYIQEHAGNGFSAKDFRTWHGTVLAALELAGEPAPESEAAAKRTISMAVNNVAESLGNTPAVCRRSYIDPRVFDAFQKGQTIAPPRGSNGPTTHKQRSQIERAVLKLIG